MQREIFQDDGVRADVLQAKAGILGKDGCRIVGNLTFDAMETTLNTRLRL
jgi:hypothetical protein